VSNQIKEISIGDFDLSLGQMRIMNMSRILETEKSMRLHGQLQPVVARLYKGGIQLIDGYKRLYAAEALLMENLQCRLLEVDEHQAKVLMLSYNWTSRSLESYEEALVLKNLQDNHAMDQRELSRVTGKSASWVSRRLGLIERLDEEIGTEIRMGVLTGSHARALMRLPRGNQLPVARVIQTHKLTTRQSDHLVDAYLSASDDKSQQLLLKAPERALYKRDVHEPQTDMYDPRLSGFGNEVAWSMQEVITSAQDLLKLLEDHRNGSLQQTERMLLSPGLELIADGLDTLKKAIDDL
jgi:ParB family transcriptional regulator, chromosome partitioning protein